MRRLRVATPAMINSTQNPATTPTNFSAQLPRAALGSGSALYQTLGPISFLIPMIPLFEIPTFRAPAAEPHRPALVAGYRLELEIRDPRGCFLPRLPILTRARRTTADGVTLLPVFDLADNQTLTDPTKPIA